MSNTDHRIADLLLEMEAELRRLGLWETEAPTLESLSSQEPFCIDTLTFVSFRSMLRHSDKPRIAILVVV